MIWFRLPPRKLLQFLLAFPIRRGDSEVDGAVVGNGVPLRAVVEGGYLVVDRVRAACAQKRLVKKGREVLPEPEPVCIIGSRPVSWI